MGGPAYNSSNDSQRTFLLGVDHLHSYNHILTLEVSRSLKPGSDNHRHNYLPLNDPDGLHYRHASQICSSGPSDVSLHSGIPGIKVDRTNETNTKRNNCIADPIRDLLNELWIIITIIYFKPL